MFERRLKILLAALALFTFVLLLRAGQVQVVQHEQWEKAAAESMKRSQLIDTVRGSILDRNGRVIAVDKPCVDVVVEYKALTDPPDPAWLAAEGDRRLKARLGEEYTKQSKARRKEQAAAEGEAVKARVAAMWAELAKLGDRTPEQLAEARAAIAGRVAMRKRIVKRANLERALAERQGRQESEEFWSRWVVEGIAGEDLDPDKYEVTVADEGQSHVVLKAVSVDVQNYLGKHADEFPGLSLRASTHRTYPFGHAACHLMGRVTRVSREDLLADPSKKDETRRYWPNDEIGRGGLESLLEPALRGTRGKVERVPGQEGELSRADPQPGKDVRVSIDIELQARVEAAFAGAELVDAQGNVQTVEMHGAAVVIDVPSGEVLALASYPTYDLNAFEEMYDKLVADEVRHPTLNRATQAQLQPGSTIKPVVGLSAITQGVKLGDNPLTPDTGIECSGFLVINGKKFGRGRCWVESKFGKLLKERGMTSAHHPVPSGAEHPTGFLTFGDALERSCNVYFETLADYMGMEGLSAWYERFGLGRPTGLGIPEARGRLPRSYVGPALDLRYKTWFSGIGQDPVSATPIQMANVAATMARGGRWYRPRLVSADVAAQFGVKLPALSPAARDIDPDDADADQPPAEAPKEWPEAYDLQLSPAAVAAMRDGMQRVVTGKAGTGKGLVRKAPSLEGIRICGKTGTAQAARFGLPRRDPVTGVHLRDPQDGRRLYDFPEPNSAVATNPDPRFAWYRAGGEDGRELAHAWYIGFAPADNPKVAFAVMVEYGGSGGMAAAAVARQTLTSCVEMGYLEPGVAPVGPKAEARPAELLRDVAAGPRAAR